MPVDHSTSNPNRFLLLIGGDDQRGASTATAWSADVVMAVDSGLNLARTLGIAVDHVVGDMDSVDPDALTAAEAAGAQIHVHPTDKDATDLELALDLTLSLQRGSTVAPPMDRSAHAWPTLEAPEIRVVGGGGGRLDHLIGDLLMLSGPRLGAWNVSAQLGEAMISVVRPSRPTSVRGTPGEQVSLLPLHGDVDGVTTEGLRWPLMDGFLAAGTSRAISNELASPIATVTISSGSLAVVQPGTRGAVAETRPGPYDPTPRPVRPNRPERKETS